MIIKIIQTIVQTILWWNGNKPHIILPLFSNIHWPVAEDLSGVTEEVSENTNKSNGTDKAEI